MGFFQDLFGQSQADANRNAAAAKAGGLAIGQQLYDTQAQQGRDALTSGYTAAQGTWQPTYNLGQSGAQAYADITGANGVVGQDRARALFSTDPGYEFALAQGLQATERQRGTGGFQGSGNVLTALTDYASGQAQQQYNNYVARLQPFLNYSLLGTSGLAGTQTGLGTALNTSWQNEAKQSADTAAGIGSAYGAGELGAVNAEAAASGNIANLAAKLLGFGTGGGSGGGSLFSGITNPNSTSLFGGAGPLFGANAPLSFVGDLTAGY